MTMVLGPQASPAARVQWNREEISRDQDMKLVLLHAGRRGRLRSQHDGHGLLSELPVRLFIYNHGLAIKPTLRALP
jgi:hypothetical protein